jgi:hypothetical protein
MTYMFDSWIDGRILMKYGGKVKRHMCETRFWKRTNVWLPHLIAAILLMSMVPFELEEAAE